jgi:hypothetical protein
MGIRGIGGSQSHASEYSSLVRYFMETELFKAILDIHKLQWFTVVLLMVAVMVSVTAASLASYAKRKGENLATKEDFEELLRQVKLTAQATEEIKAQLSQRVQVGLSELEYRKAQLSQFYGPIYANLKTSHELYNIWMSGTLREINKEMIDLFREQNKEIIRIMKTQAHLVDGGTIPDVFTRFMTAATIWNFFTARPETPRVDPNVAALPQAKWPSEFPEYIFSKTEELKKRLDDLHKRYNIDLDTAGLTQSKTTR